MITINALQRGNIGIGVNKMQAYLNMMQERGFIATRNLQDGVYGERTEQAVREWQKYSNLLEDGKIGLQTWDTIVNKLRDLGIVTNIAVASNTFYLASGAQGISVFKMQEYLNEIATTNHCLRPVPVDGMYGSRTTTMVQQFQYLYDLNIDGAIGKATWDAIINERNKL